MYMYTYRPPGWPVLFLFLFFYRLTIFIIIYYSPLAIMRRLEPGLLFESIHLPA